MDADTRRREVDEAHARVCALSNVDVDVLSLVGLSWVFVLLWCRWVGCMGVEDAVCSFRMPGQFVERLLYGVFGMCRYWENNRVRLDYRPVHMNTLDDEVEVFPPKARVY